MLHLGYWTSSLLQLLVLTLLSPTATTLPSPSPASSSFPPQTFLAALNQADLPASQVLWSGVRRVRGSVG